LVYELAGEGYPSPLILPAILYERRVLGLFLLAVFAVVAHHRDDLVRIFGVQRDEGHLVDPSVEAKYSAFSSESSFIEPKKRR